MGHPMTQRGEGKTRHVSNHKAATDIWPVLAENGKVQYIQTHIAHTKMKYD